MKSSFRSQLISIFIILIIVPIIILGISSSIISKQILKQQFNESSVAVLNETKKGISNYMQNYEQGILQLTGDQNIQGINQSTGNIQYSRSVFSNYLKSHKDVTGVYIGTKDKKMYIEPNIELPSDFDPTSRPWYKDAEAKKDIVWTKPYVDVNTHKLVVSAAAPVFSNNEFVGVVGIDVTLDTLVNILSTSKLGANGYTIILDADKNILNDKDKTKVGKPLEVKELLSAVEKDKKNVSFKEYSQKKYIQGYAAIDKIEGLDWHIIDVTYDQDISKQANKIMLNIFNVGIISLVLAIIIIILFSKIITKDFSSLVGSLGKIKDGDLSTRITLKSNNEIREISKSFNITLDKISELIRNVRNMTHQVNGSSEKLLQSSTRSSNAAEGISKSMDEVSSGAMNQSIEAQRGVQLTVELSQKLDNLKVNTQDMTESAKNIININSGSTKAIEELVDKIKYNISSIDKIENAVMELSTNSKNINNILETISSIAEQTNLLSLNASIEAARAGEYGKGFAVVADEIRKLAEDSRIATNKVHDIVTTIQGDSENAINIMNEVKVKAENQAKSTEDVSTSTKNISDAIDVIVKKIHTNSEYVESIYKDKAVIIGCMENISAICQQSVAVSEEVTASMKEENENIQTVKLSANELSKLSQQLEQEINVFKI